MLNIIKLLRIQKTSGGKITARENFASCPPPLSCGPAPRLEVKDRSGKPNMVEIQM